MASGTMADSAVTSMGDLLAGDKIAAGTDILGGLADKLSEKVGGTESAPVAQTGNENKK